MTTVTNEYLSALALLKTAYDQHGATYLDYVTPFVGDTIRSTGKSEIKTDELRAAIVDRYGLKIPKGVLNTLTRRLARRGFGHRSFGRFVPDQAKLRESYDFEEQQTGCQSAINALAVSFIAFTEAKTGRSLSDLEAIAALIKYADSNGLPILSRAHEQTPLPISLSLDEMEYITSLFVIHAFEGSLPEKETLVMLAKGSKLAGAPTSSGSAVQTLAALLYGWRVWVWENSSRPHQARITDPHHLRRPLLLPCRRPFMNHSYPGQHRFCPAPQTPLRRVTLSTGVPRLRTLDTRGKTPNATILVNAFEICAIPQFQTLYRPENRRLACFGAACCPHRS